MVGLVQNILDVSHFSALIISFSVCILQSAFCCLICNLSDFFSPVVTIKNEFFLAVSFFLVQSSVTLVLLSVCAWGGC